MAKTYRASAAQTVPHETRIAKTGAASVVRVAAMRTGVIAQHQSAQRKVSSTPINLHHETCANQESHAKALVNRVSHARALVNRVSRAVSAARAGTARKVMARQKACRTDRQVWRSIPGMQIGKTRQQRRTTLIQRATNLAKSDPVTGMVVTAASAHSAVTGPSRQAVRTQDRETRSNHWKVSPPTVFCRTTVRH